MNNKTEDVNILERLLEEADIKDIHEKKKQLAGGIKLTWNEIMSQYPDMLVGLIDTEYADTGNVISAIVVYTEKDTDRYKMEFLVSKGEITICDTHK